MTTATHALSPSCSCLTAQVVFCSALFCGFVIIFTLHRHVSSLFPFTYVVFLHAEKTPQPDRALFFPFLFDFFF